MKDAVRSQLLKKRFVLSSAKVRSKSSTIVTRLRQFSLFQDAQTILFYVSYDNEVYTHDLIKESLKSKRVIVPKCETQTQQLVCSQLYRFQDLSVGSYSILEPSDEAVSAVAVEDIEMILVPGVGFDRRGNRLGHGKGYYDRLFHLATNAVRVGLAFDFQLIENIPVEPHDVIMHYIVSESELIHCTNH